MSLAEQAGRGIAWSSAGKAAANVLSFAVTLALARLLTPEDFGLLGMILVFTGLLGVIADMGFGAALIQRQELEERHLSSVFWLSALLGLGLAAGLVAAAELIADFFREPRLVWVVRIMALDFVLSPFMVQYAVLSRNLDFRAIALAEMASAVLAGAVALALAIAGLGVWALVAQVLVTSVGTVLVLWVKSSWRPRFGFDWSAIRELWSFSTNLLGYALLNTVARRTDDLLIGRFLGAAPLGLYSRAYATMLGPVTEIGGVVARVMFPTFSRMQDDLAQTKTLYLRVIGVIALITFPVMFGVAVLAEPFILLLYGEQWVGAARVLSVFCVVGAVQSITTTTAWVFKARGRADWMFRWGLFAASVIVTSIVVGIVLGSIESVALCYAVATVLILPYPQFYLVGRLIDLRPMEVARAVGGSALAALLAAAAMFGMQRGLSAALPAAALAIVSASAGVFVYLTCVRVFKVGSYLELRAMLRKRLYDWAGARDPEAGS